MNSGYLGRTDTGPRFTVLSERPEKRDTEHATPVLVCSTV